MDQSGSGAVATGSTDAMSALMARIAERRDREAFQALFLYYGPRVKSLLIRKGADFEVAEDLMQETMLAVWNKAALYQPGKGSVATWIFTIARNLRIDRLRRESVQHFEDVDDLELGEGDRSADAQVVAQDEAVIARQEETVVRRALGTLPEEQAVIIRLSFMEDLSQREISERLDVPLGTVKSRMRLAYRKLKLALEGEL